MHTELSLMYKMLSDSDRIHGGSGPQRRGPLEETLSSELLLELEEFEHARPRRPGIAPLCEYGPSSRGAGRRPKEEADSARSGTSQERLPLVLLRRRRTSGMEVPPLQAPSGGRRGGRHAISGQRGPPPRTLRH